MTGNEYSLAGSTVLVTGCSGHIGQAIARKLASAGANVVAHCRDRETRLGELLGAIREQGVEALSVAADLADDAAVAELFDDLGQRGVRVTGLVNNAALQPVIAFDDMTRDDWRSLQNVNVDAAFQLIQCTARQLPEGGAIVNIGSIEGLDPARGHAHYSSSKAALDMLTRAAAQELGSRNIRVNTVSPGLIDRDGLRDDWPEGVRRWEERAPLGRLGSPDDVANAVQFLLSPAADWVSGANLVVDGGMSSIARW